jgi:hypothetical protein
MELGRKFAVRTPTIAPAIRIRLTIHRGRRNERISTHASVSERGDDCACERANSRISNRAGAGGSSASPKSVTANFSP